MSTPRNQSNIGNRTSRLTSIIVINLLLLHSVPIHAASPTASATPSRRVRLPLNKNRNGQFRRRFNKPFLPHPTLDTDLACLHSNGELLERLRGGGLLGGTKNTSSADSKSLSKTPSQEVVSTNKSQNKALRLGTFTITLLAIRLSILHWDTLKSSFSTFFDAERFRKAIIQNLNNIASKGNTGLLLYTFGFIFWEACGLPTSVVETAAGMAFGFQKGLLCSFVGKTAGSVLAFTLGRTLLSNIVGRKMEDSEPFGLIQRGVTRNPMLSAFIVRYSVFPQLIKNFGMSLTNGVTFPMFLLVIMVHGFPFSLIWAALGNDSSLRLRASESGETMAANVILSGLVLFVTAFGFLVSPAITGWWLADLRREN
mmetsp:Transcript_9712/g.21901  ORF Transcript_9712/g.21901 Transcript_9712/m.21901 type:complete len:369 (-) Transcript_9712:74-1180(-)